MKGIRERPSTSCRGSSMADTFGTFTPLLAANAVLSCQSTFCAELCSNSIWEVLSLVLLLSANTEVEAQREEASFPRPHNKTVSEIMRLPLLTLA